MSDTIMRREMPGPIRHPSYAAFRGDTACMSCGVEIIYTSCEDGTYMLYGCTVGERDFDTGNAYCPDCWIDEEN